MIIYKIQENGKATNFQFAQKCPAGWKSIEGDRIPEDISKYHEQRYIDAEALKTQRKTCQTLLDASDKRMVSDWPYPEDKAKNEAYRAELRVCMASDKLVDIPKDPFS